MVAQKKVTTIPATLSRFTAVPITEQRKRRVAAYARVSTDHEEQLTSYEAQIDFYTNYIRSHEGWEFVEVYTDEGITGTSTKHREGFKRMVADALAGKIDLIVTKSVSRFARNTVDSLTTIRTLKEHGVECYFEKENIWTFDGKGELLITIMSSLAQEESRSISENCTWGQRKRFADGKVTVPFNRFLGYDKGEDGNLVVNREQAKIVERIYAMFLQGMTPHSIAAALTRDGIPSPGHRPKWSAQSVRSILSNEKYKGDALLQKSFTVDFLSKKKKKNEGELPSFYVTGNHEGIVSPEVFDMVQTELARRKPGKNRHSGIHVFSGIVYCDHCGSLFGSKVWHSNDQYRRVIWQCNHKYAGDEVCPTPHVDEKHLTDAFLSALNKILPNQKAIRKTVEGVIATALNTDELSRQREELLAEMEVVNQMIADGIRENASVVQDQDEYEKRYKMLCDRADGIKAKCNILESQIEDRSTRRGAIEHFLTALERQAAPVAEFDPAAFHLLTERMTVHENGHITIQFKDGTEITE